MNQKPDFEMDGLDEEIDRAFRLDPLEEPPARLAASVMSRVRGHIPAPNFKLHWVDYFVAAFCASMLAAVFLVTQTLPPTFGLTLRVDLQYLLYRAALAGPSPWVWTGTLVMGTACVLITARVLREFRLKR
jgi:hypothetical protein